MLIRALNATADTDTPVRSICLELPAVQGGAAAPEWIPYMPAPDANGWVTGEDGRQWRLPNPRALAGKVRRKLPVDFNHSNDLVAPLGGESPATGWILEFEVRDDNTTWARVDWNERGLNALRGRDYGFISPAFDHDKAGVIARYAGASLVNHPNFTTLPALNRAGANPAGDPDMKIPKSILDALNLKEDATEDEAVRAINAKQADLERATNAAKTPDLNRYVPRADHDAAVERATAAEQKLKEDADARLKAEVDAEITAALKAGRITPASEEYHRSICAQEGGLEKFRQFVKVTPKVVDDDPTATGARPAGADSEDPDALAERALNYQKAQADLGRSISIAQAMTHITRNKE